jgi:thioredoxin reductase
MADSDCEVAIIGGGPAGLSAGLVLGRARRRVLICDSGHYRNEASDALHCYLGFDGVSPLRFRDIAHGQLDPYDSVRRIAKCVTSARRAGAEFELTFNDDTKARARKLLVATGVVDELPAIDGIQDFYGHSIHVCPYCDGWEHRDATVAVYGEGKKGVELARLLRQWTENLLLCPGGPAKLEDEDKTALSKLGVSICEKVPVKLEGRNQKLQRIVFKDGSSLQCDAMFFSTGQHHRSKLLRELGCAFDPDGGVTCAENCTTSVAGVYVAGDASRDVQLIIIAAAEGARAALAINKALVEEGA